MSIQEYPETPAPNKRISLVDLGYDVLHLILSRLLSGDNSDSGRRSDLVSFSFVSKGLRQCTLPILFRDVSWPKEGTEEFYPSELWGYIQRVKLVQARWTAGQNHELSLAILSQVLPKLPNLATFAYSLRAQPPSLDFISSLIENDFCSLTSLHVSTCFLARDYSGYFVHISNLQEIVIKQPERSTSLYAAPESKRILSMQCASNLMLGSRKTLVHLDLPGEYFSLPTLASLPETETFLEMRRLIIRGYPPMYLEDYPIWRVLAAMPGLRSVEIDCKLRMIGVSPHRYVLMPTNPPNLPEKPHIFPRFLKTLMICNPSLTDNVLRRLPDSLQCLVLDFVPYWDVMNTGSDLLAYHNPENLVSMFRAVHREVGSMPWVDHLRINMGWCVTPELLSWICMVFPGLQILELQGIRYFDRQSEGTGHSNLALFANNLAKLNYLKTLKLAVELEEDPYTEDDDHRKIGSVDVSSQLWANTLATQVESLSRIAFEKRRHTGKTIGSRAVVGEALWVWYFRNSDPDEEGNVMRRSGDTAVDWDLLDRSFRW
ncbi:hypothetical protein V5O48_008021 [Marasmius crinis-equi]|uniref:F-box domain-containing protein n=1 Tax=Marasmius crinis-equi TaxID=585013 RepID=A0ABR3FF45_9AGAR